MGIKSGPGNSQETFCLDAKFGRAERAKVMGNELTDQVYATADDMQLDQQNYVSTICWGEIFNRPGMAKKMRILVNLATLTALGERETLRHHVRAAHRIGCSRIEIREAIIQAGSIAGPIRAAQACRIASEALADSAD